MEVKEGGSSEGGQGAPSMAHTAVQIWHCFDHACNNIWWLELPLDGAPTRVLNFNK
jgi:hypothetical protein